MTYNDILSFNHQIGIALIENDDARLSRDAAASIGVRHAGVAYPAFIEENFEGIYFTGEENRWLDAAVGNIRRIERRFERAIAWHSLFQSAVAKRPYNLFHRRNLYMRTAEVTRGFGNKKSWDRSFDDHFRAFAEEANRAVVLTGLPCRAVCSDVLQLESNYDLVYIDTPYISRRGVGVDYRDFYHFLEGMVRYDEWPNMIDRTSKHRRLRREPDPWSDATQCRGCFERLFDRFRESILVVSYRSDGVPSIVELAEMLRAVKRRVRVLDLGRNQYALSTARDTSEVLLIGTDG